MAGSIAGFGNVNLPGTLTVALLTEGTTALTTVRGTPDHPFLLVNDQRLPLPEKNLQPGDVVRVTRLPDADGSPRFSIAREATTAEAAPSAADALPQILARLSQIAGRALPEALVPPSFPAGDAIRQLVALFQEGNALGPQLDKLATLLRNAGQAKQPTFQTLSNLLEQLGTLQTADPAQLAALLKSLVQRRAPEAKLANATPAELAALAEDDLASAIARLQDDPAVRAALQQAGKLDDFLEATRGLLDRLDGARAQQLHGPEQGYVFLELPLPKEAGFRHAAAHFYQEGRAKSGTRDSLPSVAVLDLDLTHLGPLWVSVRALGGTCTCEVLAANSATAAGLQEAAPQIADALKTAGYEHVQVRTGAWDGDRITKTASLLATLRPLDLSI